VPRGGEAAQVRSQRHYQLLGDPPPYPWDRIQPLDDLLTRAAALRDLRAHPVDFLVQEVEVGEDRRLAGGDGLEVLEHSDELVRAQVPVRDELRIQDNPQHGPIQGRHRPLRPEHPADQLDHVTKRN